MSLPYDKFNWYHIIASNPGFVWSTAANAYVADNDATYLAWVAAGGEVGLFDTEAQLWEALRQRPALLTKVAVIATSNTAIATALEAGDTVDSYTLVLNDLVALASQTDPTENGLYRVPASGATPRAWDVMGSYLDYQSAYFIAESGGNSGLVVSYRWGGAAGPLDSQNLVPFQNQVFERTQDQNTFLGVPVGGSPAAPDFRSLVFADLFAFTDTDGTLAANSDSKIATQKAVKTYVDGSAWTAYTPTISSGAGTITTSSATGRWRATGKSVEFTAQVTITTNGTGATYLGVTLPATAARAFAFAGVEDSVANKAVKAKNSAASNLMVCYFYDGTYPGADGAVVTISGVFEQS